MSWYGNNFPYTAQAIAMNTPNKSGVYVVWRTDTTIYVGESNDLARTLLAHQKAQRGGPHPSDRCSSQLRWNPGS